METHFVFPNKKNMDKIPCKYRHKASNYDPCGFVDYIFGGVNDDVHVGSSSLVDLRENDFKSFDNHVPFDYGTDYFYENSWAGLNKDMNIEFVDKQDVLSEDEPSNFHSWANESSIEDVIFSSGNNNVDVTSSIFEAICNFKDKDVNAHKVHCNGNGFRPSKYQENYFDSWNVQALIDDIFVNPISSAIEALCSFVNGIGKVDNDVNGFGHFGRKGPSFVEPTDISSINTALPQPDEKEDDEDVFMPYRRPDEKEDDEDVFMSYRREAFEAEKSARKYSKQAKAAHARGDPESENRFSYLENQEWSRAEKLHAEAAKDILAEKNRNFDQWTLDLHGLRKMEAVDALRDRLQAIESSLKKSPDQQAKRLRAITGWGKHSKGEPVLPGAVKTFLKDNGYHFDDSKLGSFLILPRPKAAKG